MNRIELLERVVELEQEIRELKAKSESGHCFGCLCRQNVIYYPGGFGTPGVTWQMPGTPAAGTASPKP